MADGELVTDPAALAFEGIGAELKLLRLAVQAFTAEKTQITIPDYSETLTEIVARLDKQHGNFQKIMERPAMQQSAQDIAAHIVSEGKVARADESLALERARVALVDSSKAIIARVNGAWDRDVQKKWGLSIAAVIAITFTVIGATAPGIVDRLVPTNWRWPELRAASNLGMGLSEAGLHLISIDGSEEGARLRWSHRIIDDNIETLKQCETKATKAQSSKQCTLSVTPPPKEL